MAHWHADKIQNFNKPTNLRFLPIIGEKRDKSEFCPPFEKKFVLPHNRSLQMTAFLPSPHIILELLPVIPACSSPTSLLQHPPPSCSPLSVDPSRPSHHHESSSLRAEDAFFAVLSLRLISGLHYSHHFLPFLQTSPLLALVADLRDHWRLTPSALR